LHLAYEYMINSFSSSQLAYYLKPLRKPMTFRLPLIFLTVFLVISSFLLMSANAQSTAVVSHIVGKVYGGKLAYQIRQGHRLKFGEKITVTQKAALGARLSNGSMLILASDTKITVLTPRGGPRNNDDEIGHLMNSGLVRYIAADKEVVETIRSKTAAIDAKGAAFDIVMTKQHMNVYVYAGDVAQVPESNNITIHDLRPQDQTQDLSRINSPVQMSAPLVLAGLTEYFDQDVRQAFAHLYESVAIAEQEEVTPPIEEVVEEIVEEEKTAAVKETPKISSIAQLLEYTKSAQGVPETGPETGLDGLAVVVAEGVAAVEGETETSAPVNIPQKTTKFERHFGAASPRINPNPESEEIQFDLADADLMRIRLQFGDIVIKLNPDFAPLHVRRIKQLAYEGFYNGLVFHRAIEGFMAQTGDPTGTGTGGSGMKLVAEFSGEPFIRGSVGMARSRSKNSGDSQFFIMYDRAENLDGQYTLWGHVVDGMEIADEIAKGEPPERASRIEKVDIGWSVEKAIELAREQGIDPPPPAPAQAATSSPTPEN
jgi:peptidylprolyl isomerase